ncbi:MAG: hypothetical protein JWR73_3393 [Tardiphaga sp.]|nr:hypothetical protein [Tardiphaga sp.]
MSGQGDRPPVAGCQQIVLTVTTAAPDRADSVDHIAGGKPVTRRDLGLAGGAAMQRAAGSKQLRTGGAVDRTIDPAAAQQGLIGSIDDGVYGQRRDVGDDDLKSRRAGLSDDRGSAQVALRPPGR